MYLKKAFNKGTGRIYLSIAEGYWDRERGHTRTKIIEKIGFLDELQHEYDDPIAHFAEIVDKRNRAAKAEAAEYTIMAKKNQKLEKNTANRRNYGYIIIMKIFYELGLVFTPPPAVPKPPRRRVPFPPKRLSRNCAPTHKGL